MPSLDEETLADDILYVFDKDGVLVDSEPIKLELFERLFDDFPLQSAAICAYNRKNVGMPRRQKLQHILKEILRLDDWDRQVDIYLDRSYHFIKEPLLKAPPMPGVLDFIHQSPNRKFVCSVALREEVMDQLEALSLIDAFEEVYAFPEQKAIALKALRDRNEGKVVFWGDTILDWQAAQAAGVGFIGVSKPGGHQAFQDMPEVPTIPDFQDTARVLEMVRQCL